MATKRKRVRAKPVRRTQAQRSAATQQLLLEATLKILVEQGYLRLATAEICERAGVSRGAQLHHYPTKALLVAAAVEHLLQRRLSQVHALFESMPRGPDRLRLAFSEMWRIYSGPTLAAWTEIVVAARTDKELRRVVAAVNKRFVAEAERAFRALVGLPPDADVRAPARMVLAIFDGLALNRLVDRDAELPTQVIELFGALLSPWLSGAGRSS